jgi:predicted alpha/beta-hydrolase family hydrolase
MLVGIGRLNLGGWIFLLCLAWAGAVQAGADYAREKKWADEISPGIVVGDPVYLQEKDGRKFLSIYTPAPNARGAVIIAHGMGVHPDYGLYGQLRTLLPERGYTTLSIQMPVLAADAKADDYPPLFPEAAERMAAAAAWLKARGYDRIALVTHSMGARMGNYYLTHTGAPGVQAWVAIGIPIPFEKPNEIPVPTLDIHGDHDLPTVLKGTAERAFYLRRVQGSAQVVVAGADHYFTGKEPDLARFIGNFLDKALPK